MTAENKLWWCETCQVEVQPRDVTHDETHDLRANGCGQHVFPEKPEPRTSNERVYTPNDLWGGPAVELTEQWPNAWRVFLERMSGKHYGTGPLTTGWLWFVEGYVAGKLSGADVETPGCRSVLHDIYRSLCVAWDNRTLPASVLSAAQFIAMREALEIPFPGYAKPGAPPEKDNDAPTMASSSLSSNPTGD